METVSHYPFHIQCFRLHTISSTFLRNSKKRRILMKKKFQTWKQYSHFAKFIKQAFISRMELFLRHYYLRYGFCSLLSLHRRKLLGNQVESRNNFLQLSFCLKRWLLMFHRKQYARSQVSALIKHVYVKSLPIYFVIWKLKVTNGRRISRSTILKRAIEKWKKMFIASRYCRFIHLIKVFSAWRELVEIKNNTIRLFQRRQYSLFELFSRLHLIDYTLLLLDLIFHYFRFNQSCHRDVKDTFKVWRESLDSVKENIEVESNRLR